MNLSKSNKLKISNLLSGIGRKFIIYFILFSAIPIVLISILGYKISEEIVIKQNIRYLELQNELVQNRLNDFFQKAHFDISYRNPANTSVYDWIQQRLDEPLPENCKDAQNIRYFFQENVEKYSSIASMALMDTSGNILCATDSTFFRMSDKTLKKLVGSKQRIISTPTQPKIKTPHIFLVKPINPNTTQNRAFVIGLMDVDEITQIASYFGTKRQISQIFILDQKNQILFSSQNAADLNSEKLQKVQFTYADDFFSRWDEKEVLRVVNHFPMFQWKIVSDVTYQNAMADLILLRNQAILGVGALLIILIILAFYMSQRISVPIRQLAYAAQDIGEGYLDTPIKIKTKDELALLANELDRMRQNLLDYYENLESKVQERTRELKRAQFQIMHQEKMASIGLLAAGIAHEIGNPLTSISSLTQLLKRRLKDDTNLNYLTTIMKNIDRISRIVRELVDFSRPSRYESLLTDINQVIQAAVGIVKYDKRSKNINIHLDLDSNMERTVLVADQLLQVIINILFNAVDAMEGYGNDLYVKTFQENKKIYIRIQDTGSGIPESELNKIFEPFYTTKDVGAGTGLGLSVSYGIIRNFDGDIEVQSTVGKGSTFTIKLPIKSSKDE